MKLLTDIEKLKSDLRTAFADYYYSEGCNCCEDTDIHYPARRRIGVLLDVDLCEDGFSHDWEKYRSVNLNPPDHSANS